MRILQGSGFFLRFQTHARNVVTSLHRTTGRATPLSRRPFLPPAAVPTKGGRIVAPKEIPHDADKQNENKDGHVAYLKCGQISCNQPISLCGSEIVYHPICVFIADRRNGFGGVISPGLLKMGQRFGGSGWLRSLGGIGGLRQEGLGHLFGPMQGLSLPCPQFRPAFTRLQQPPWQNRHAQNATQAPSPASTLPRGQGQTPPHHQELASWHGQHGPWARHPETADREFHRLQRS